MLVRLEEELLGVDQAGWQKQLGTIRQAGRLAVGNQQSQIVKGMSGSGTSPEGGPRLERMQAGLRDTSTTTSVHRFCALGL